MPDSRLSASDPASPLPTVTAPQILGRSAPRCCRSDCECAAPRLTATGPRVLQLREDGPFSFDHDNPEASVTLREALGGRWATHWLLWLSLYPPTTVLIVIRESTTNYPAWWWPLASATAQHVIAGVIIVGGGAWARRRWPVLPLGVVASLWALATVVRAVIGSTVAETLADVPGDMMFRLISWSLITLAWTPALVYAIAQIERRQTLIGELEQAERTLRSARARAADSSHAMHRRLVSSVERSVAPVLEDLQRRLAAVRDNLDPAVFTDISDRLAQLHSDTSELLDSVVAAPVEPVGPRRASLREVFDVHLTSPWLIAGLVSLETLALVLLDAWRIFGNQTAAEILVAGLASGALLGVTLRLAADWRLLSRLRGSSVTLAAAALAILLQSAILILGSIDSDAGRGVLLTPILGAGLLVASSVVIGALVVARANAVDDRTLHAVRVEVLDLDAEHDAALDRERHRVSELMHGPIQGRIAACVMALTFFTSPDAPEGSLAAITDDVLDHLKAASRDLSQLAVSSAPEASA
jgi:hypothetical protein